MAMPGAASSPQAPKRGPVIALIAGEASGDRLGAALIRAVRSRAPDCWFVGVTGEAMRGVGCETLAGIDTLSVMGLVEILMHLPRLLRLRRRLARDVLRLRPDVVVGIDSPDFNLGLERRLRARGLRTVHYVSPSVWAWRPRRVHTVARAAEAVLCLLPFEPACYRGVPIRALFTGHPLADELCPSEAAGARGRLGLPQDGRVLALLPGSRAGEVGRLAPVFMAAAAALVRDRPDLRVVVPVASEALRGPIASAAADAGLDATLVSGQAHDAVTAADTALVASGTATLETLFLDRPMVVAYRVSPVTAGLMRRTRALKTRYYALPNLLAGREVVPELIQEQASVARIVPALGELLDDEQARTRQLTAFSAVRKSLGHGAADRAAAAILDLLGHPAPQERDH